jgi:two-component system phosphate regulon response regulator PhoB
MASNSILLVEDDAEIREMLRFNLERAQFTIIEAESAEMALSLLHTGSQPAVIIVDWMLPGMSGVELVRRLRGEEPTSETPMILLTARTEEQDKLKGFEQGVDDYITKPFSPRELIARVRALQRRAGIPAGSLLCVGPLTLDLRNHELLLDGVPVHISPTEFRLLEMLINHPGRTFSRSQLLDRVWGRSAYVEERTVDVHVLRLRKLLQPAGLDDLLQTVRGVGYRFIEKAS